MRAARPSIIPIGDDRRRSETVRAARLHEIGKPLRIDEVPVPEVSGDEVLVRIAGAGVCHTDVHVRSGEFPLPSDAEWPLTLGHENAGFVEAAGPEATGLEKGDPVIVWGARGCGRCRHCRQGHESVCNIAHWVAGGGYADYMHLPESRLAVRLDGIDPAEAAPLADAGLTPYRAIKRALPYLYPGGTAVLIGIGGLGHLAIQILRALSPGTEILAVDVNGDRLALALELGADRAIDARGDPIAEIARLTRGDGASAVLDLVGLDSTLRVAAAAVARRGILVQVGIGGGTLPLGFFATRPEAVITNSFWGSREELEELVALGAQGRVRARITRYALAEVNEVLDMLERGEISGRAVLVP
jgi:propanol-preferring alcohol dehydrogenase